VVFDLETTGHSRQRDEIIEVAGQFLDPIGIQLEDGVFEQLVRPNQCVSPFITQLTTITNDLVRNSERFPAVADAFIRFMQGRADEYSAEKGITIGHIILVAHNGKGFNIPFFVQQLSKHNTLNLLFDDGRFGYGIDTLQVARTAVKNHPDASVPTSYSLPILFQFISGAPPTLSHRAMADVKATISMFYDTKYFGKHGKNAFFYSKDRTTCLLLLPCQLSMLLLLSCQLSMLVRTTMTLTPA
jgi:ATP-dependent DNA helicase DinG